MVCFFVKHMEVISQFFLQWWQWCDSRSQLYRKQYTSGCSNRGYASDSKGKAALIEPILVIVRREHRKKQVLQSENTSWSRSVLAAQRTAQTQNSNSNLNSELLFWQVSQRAARLQESERYFHKGWQHGKSWVSSLVDSRKWQRQTFKWKSTACSICEELLERWQKNRVKLTEWSYLWHAASLVWHLFQAGSV